MQGSSETRAGAFPFVRERAALRPAKAEPRNRGRTVKGKTMQEHIATTHKDKTRAARWKAGVLRLVAALVRERQQGTAAVEASAASGWERLDRLEAGLPRRQATRAIGEVPVTRLVSDFVEQVLTRR